MRLTKNEVNEMKREVNNKTGYNLNQIDIVAFGEDFIDYNIYENYENDYRLGKKPINSGTIKRN